MQRHVWYMLLPVLFLAYSLPIFLRVYATTQSVIDEEFHLRQGLNFCNKRLDVWDRKITTFPGLYLAAMVLTLFDFCSVLGLRLISLIAAVINIILLFKIRTQLFSLNSALKLSYVHAALDAFTISILPPLYFFTHLYYTDMLALTTVLCFYDQWLLKKHLPAAVYGRYISRPIKVSGKEKYIAASSVLMRQTNVVWVGMLCGITALDIITENYAKKRQLPIEKVSLLSLETLFDIIKNQRLFWLNVYEIVRHCCYYLIIMLPFVGFVVINGSVVLGDKAAHQVSIHLPQLFYFALFTMFFAISNTLQQFKNAWHNLRSERLITLFIIGVAVLIVKWNTLEHPYLLADNRHYIFYIWQRFYARFSWFRYAIVPLYIYALMIIHCSIRHMRTNFLIMFTVAVFLSLCFQKLLELRYFIIPYVFLRLHTLPWVHGQWPKRSSVPQWLELAQHIVINALTFYIFFTKEIQWADFKEPQRIIW